MYVFDLFAVGGPGVKQKVAVKRHTPKENVEPVHDTKRQTTEAAVKQVNNGIGWEEVDDLLRQILCCFKVVG